MSEPKPLNPTEQDALVKQIGLTLMRAAPEDWRSVIAQYRANGRYFELEAELRLQDGSKHAWAVPQDVATLFAKLHGVVGQREMFDAQIPPCPGLVSSPGFAF